MTYIPSFIKIGSGTQKSNGRAYPVGQSGDFARAIINFHEKEIRLKMDLKIRRERFYLNGVANCF
jgi:hypothetical protein